MPPPDSLFYRGRKFSSCLQHKWQGISSTLWKRRHWLICFGIFQSRYGMEVNAKICELYAFPDSIVKFTSGEIFSFVEAVHGSAHSSSENPETICLMQFFLMHCAHKYCTVLLSVLAFSWDSFSAVFIIIFFRF